MLRKNFFSAQEIIAITKDFHSAGLNPSEVALMEYAQKVAINAGQTEAGDFERMRGFGYSDEDILNITLTAAARCYFSKTLDALGAEPDPAYHALEPDLVEALVGQRPF